MHTPLGPPGSHQPPGPRGGRRCRRWLVTPLPLTTELWATGVRLNLDGSPLTLFKLGGVLEILVFYSVTCWHKHVYNFFVYITKNVGGPWNLFRFVKWLLRHCSLLPFPFNLPLIPPRRGPILRAYIYICCILCCTLCTR